MCAPTDPKQLLRKKDEEGAKAPEIGSATEAALQVIPRDINTRDVTVSGELQMIGRHRAPKYLADGF